MQPYPVLNIDSQKNYLLSQQLDLIASLTGGCAYLCYISSANIECLSSQQNHSIFSIDWIKQHTQKVLNQAPSLPVDLYTKKITLFNQELYGVFFLDSPKSSKNENLFNTFYRSIVQILESILKELEPLLQISIPQFINNFNEHWWIKNAQGEYLCYNNAALDELDKSQLWCADRNNYRGKKDTDFFNKAFAQHAIDTDNLTLNAQTQLFFEEGSNFILDFMDINSYELIKTPIKDPLGKRIGIIGLIRDTSMYMPRDDSYLFKAKSFYNALESILIISHHQKILDCNPFFLKNAFFEKDQIINHYLNEFISPEELLDLTPLLNQLRKNDQVEGQSQFIDNMGNRIAIHFSAQKIYYKYGKNHAYIVNMQTLHNKSNLDFLHKEKLEIQHHTLQLQYDDLKDKVELLEKQKKEYQTLFQASSDGLWYLHMPSDGEIDKDTYVYWSQKYINMLGYQSKADFPHKLGSIFQHLHINDYERTVNKLLALFYRSIKETELTITCRIRRKTGEYHWFNLYAKVSLNKLGHVSMLSGRLIDIDTQILEHMAMQGMSPVVITDNKNKIIKINTSFTREFGYTEEDVLHKNPSLFQDTVTLPKQYDHIQFDLITQGYWSGEIYCKCKNSYKTIPILLNIKKVEFEDELFHYVGTYTNISDQKKMEKKLKYLSEIDTLTQCYNRFVFDREISFAVKNINRYTQKNTFLVILDIDFFKKVNDTYGHQQGDDVIYTLAKILNECSRNTDIVSRIGGEEFALILPCTTSEQAKTLLIRIYNRINHNQLLIRGGNTKLQFTASLGITQLRIEDSVELAYQRADANLYFAKKIGRNSICGDNHHIIISNPL